MTEPADDLAGPPPGDLSLGELQTLIERMYSAKDRRRGPEGTFMWLAEEIGELAADVRDYGSGRQTKSALAAEFADVLAWLATLANVLEVDLAEAVRLKYGGGCPGCAAMVCHCDDEVKP